MAEKTKKKKTVFYAGDGFADRLRGELEKKAPTAGSVVIYPEKEEDVSGYLKRLTGKMKVAPGFSGADLLILELHCLGNLLIRELSEEPKKYSGEESLPAMDALKGLISLIRESYGPREVIIIQSHRPRYYIMDDDLIRPVPKKPEAKEAFETLRRCEDHIMEQTGAVLVKTTYAYFYRKSIGYMLNSRTYEQECYEDIAGKIWGYLRNGKKIRKVPNFGLCVDRYARLQGKTIQWDTFRVFLNDENLLERFLLTVPADYARDHRAQLVEAHRVKNSGFENWKQGIYEAIPSDPDFCNVLTAFVALSEERNDADENAVRKMFRQGIVERKLLGRIQQYSFEQNLAMPVQITPHNAGYYYAIMMGHGQEEAKGFVSDPSGILPVPVDIFGSCISRTCLREHYSGVVSLAANKYWFQIPAYLPSQEAPDYDKGVMENRRDFYSRNVSLQLENGVIDDILSSQAEWLLIDLYGLMQPHLYSHEGFVYTDFKGNIAKDLKDRRVNVLTEDILGSKEDILERMEPWLDAIKKKYGDQIILLEVNYSYLSKGDDNVIYAPRNQENAESRNAFFAQAFDYVRDKLDCYTIEITHEFCPDDRGYQKRSTVHYSYDFYEQAGKILDHIVRNRPGQKRFAAYDNRVRTRRMADMLEKNDPRTVALFFTRPLDGYVLNVPAELIRNNEEIIASWYDSSIDSPEELERIWEPGWDPQLKNIILSGEGIQVTAGEVDLPKDYRPEPRKEVNEKEAAEPKPPEKTRKSGLFGGAFPRIFNR